MKTIGFVFFLIFFFTLNSYCQLGRSEDYSINPSWEYYSDNTLSTVASGMGYTGIAYEGDISSVAINPSSLNIAKKFQIYAGYTYKSVLNRSMYGTGSYIKPNLPSGIIGGVYKINDYIQTGLMYRNNYSYRVVLEDVSTINSPNSSMELVYKYATHSFSIPVSFCYKWFRLGADINLTYYRYDSKGIGNSILVGSESVDGHADLWKFVPQFGFIITPVNNFSFGATFTPGFTDSAVYKSDNTTGTVSSLVKYPNRIGIGTLLKLMNNNLLIALDYQYSGTSKLKYLKDMHNIHFGAEYKVNDAWKIRGGFYTLYDLRDNNTNNIYTDEVGSYDMYFLTIGSSYKYKNTSFNVALMNSNLFTSSRVNHTKISGGVCFDL